MTSKRIRRAQVADLKIREKSQVRGFDDFQMNLLTEHGIANPLFEDTKLTRNKIKSLMSVWGTDFVDPV